MTIRICQNCNKKFDRKSNYMEHIDPNRKYPCIKNVQEEETHNEITNLKEKLAEFEKRELIHRTKIEYYEKEIKHYERENEYLREQLDKERNKNSINITNNNNNNTLLMVNYIMNNHDKTPSIEISDDYMEVLGAKSREDMKNSIVVCNNLGRLYEYVGSYIIKKYKKDNILDQNLFCTDISRDNYIMKIAPCGGNKNLKGKWIKDKGGVTLKNKIVKPMVDYICQILHEELKNKENNDILKESSMLLKLTDTLCTIKGKEFMGKLLKEVGPELQIRL